MLIRIRRHDKISKETQVWFLFCIDILFKPSAKYSRFIQTENWGSVSYTDQSKHC